MPSTPLTRALLGLLCACALLPASAHAGAGLSASMTLDDPAVSAGQTARAGTLTFTNANTDDPGQPAEGNATVCRHDEDINALPACANAEGIVVTMSCGAVTPSGPCRTSATPPSGADPDVFRVGATASGVAGTACAGLAFSVVRVSGEAGKFRLSPNGGAHVVLPANGSACSIRFSYDVLKVATLDSDPVRAGIQTDQVIEVTEQSGAGNLGAGQGTRRGLLTVNKATPAIATTASPAITLGAGTLRDTATVTGRVAPAAGATIDFRLYGPSDPTCAGPPVFETLGVAYPANDAVVGSGEDTPTVAGTYRWRATYSGDANNASVTGDCADPAEAVVVSAPPAPRPTTPAPCVPPGTTPAPPATADTPVCKRGRAAIAGPSGCLRKPTEVEVRGVEVAKLVFVLDKDKIKTLTQPNAKDVYVVTLTPKGLKRGLHRLAVRTTFTDASGTADRTLRLAFRVGCDRSGDKPAFTG